MIPVPDKRPAGAARLFLVTVVGTTLALSGCASTEAGAAPDPTSATPTPTTPDPVSGTGPTEFPGVGFTIPEDARSVVVDFECAGGGTFSVELGDSMMLGQAPLSGTCDGTSQLSWPITERTGSTLYVVVADGVDWAATPRFSTEEFAYDSALEADCERFAGIYSALMNADSGYSHYHAFDETEWTSRVDAAAADLETLATSAQSGLGDAFTKLQTLVIDPARTVGSVVTASAQEAIGEISEACNANQTPLILIGEFGG